jgi:LysR family transcriptional regulator, transcriptional activator for bauABCD operon
MNTKLKQHRAVLANVSEADVRLLRIFIAIAQAGGLAAAELVLNISRSVISRHLKDLETRLGVRLCERGRAGFSLTAEGAVVLQAARELLDQIDRFRNQIAQLHHDMRGDLHVAVFDKFVSNPHCRLSQALAALGEHAPAVRVHVHIASGSAGEQGVIEGRFAVAVLPFHRASESVRTVPLFREQMHLYGAAAHACAQGTPTLDALRRAAFVGLPYHSQNMETYWRLGLEPQATATDQEGTLALIHSGRYLGFLPEHYAQRFVDTAHIARVAVDGFSYECEWQAAVRRLPAPTRLASVFMECLIAAHRDNFR